MKEEKPDWVPEDAVDWGYKVTRKDRTSLVPPSCRGWPCPETTGSGTTLLYPHGKEVVSTSFCDCRHACCSGIHYFHSMKQAAKWMLIFAKRSLKRKPSSLELRRKYFKYSFKPDFCVNIIRRLMRRSTVLFL